GGFPADRREPTGQAPVCSGCSRGKRGCRMIQRSTVLRATRGLAVAAAIAAIVGSVVPRPAYAVSPGEAVGIGLGALAVGTALGAGAYPYGYPYGYYYPPASYYPPAPYYPS